MPGRVGSGHASPIAPGQLGPRTHRPALGKSAHRAPGITAAAWRRESLDAAGPALISPRCCPPPDSHSPAPPCSPPRHRLTGAALGVPGTQPPEPRFTAVAAGPLHVGPARTGGLCLGEGTEDQDGSLPRTPYPKPSALEPRHSPISGPSLERGQRTSQGKKRPEVAKATEQRGSEGRPSPEGRPGLTSGRPGSAGARPAGWQEPAGERPSLRSLRRHGLRWPQASPGLARTHGCTEPPVRLPHGSGRDAEAAAARAPTHPPPLQGQERGRQAARPANVCVNAGRTDRCEHACTKPEDTGRWTCTPRTEPRTWPATVHAQHAVLTWPCAGTAAGTHAGAHAARARGRHRKDTHGTGQAHGTRSPSQ